jgi:hypothetical protein
MTQLIRDASACAAAAGYQHNKAKGQLMLS